MMLFLHRFFGALVLDSGAFEDIERDRHAAMQSVLVVVAACLAAGVGTIGLGIVSLPGFITAALVALGAWLVWAAAVAALGTYALAEPDTHSDVRELLRVLGFATAPAVFIAFAAIRAVAPLVAVIVTVWMIAAAVVAIRQALDYHHTLRAAAVCIIAWLLSIGVLAAVSALFTVSVS
jgi:hypothetical protein